MLAGGNLGELLGMSAYSFVAVLCLTLWHSILCVNSLVSSNPIKSPCRYLKLFLCVAPLSSTLPLYLDSAVSQTLMSLSL